MRQFVNLRIKIEYNVNETQATLITKTLVVS